MKKTSSPLSSLPPLSPPPPRPEEQGAPSATAAEEAAAEEAEEEEEQREMQRRLEKEKGAFQHLADTAADFPIRRGSSVRPVPESPNRSSDRKQPERRPRDARH